MAVNDVEATYTTGTNTTEIMTPELTSTNASNGVYKMFAVTTSTITLFKLCQ